eukprot:gnl/MRDRNA2_/MRDRNA2_136497_c0_seq1.p1 gnl/MRDRNA2_/MRDRNA2_136497_c0~~gnl/MRDRNA2_/MRDRNA2_136497_c0_seq1.p1  ORF type:complete len:991 (+),score=172.60 gnl/MRDRNA2_/MRDRNA2_136497_c0_seq1:104-2974(+)
MSITVNATYLVPGVAHRLCVDSDGASTLLTFEDSGYSVFVLDLDIIDKAVKYSKNSQMRIRCPRGCSPKAQLFLGVGCTRPSNANLTHPSEPKKYTPVATVQGPGPTWTANLNTFSLPVGTHYDVCLDTDGPGPLGFGVIGRAYLTGINLAMPVTPIQAQPSQAISITSCTGCTAGTTGYLATACDSTEVDGTGPSIPGVRTATSSLKPLAGGKWSIPVDASMLHVGHRYHICADLDGAGTTLETGFLNHDVFLAGVAAIVTRVGQEIEKPLVQKADGAEIFLYCPKGCSAVTRAYLGLQCDSSPGLNGSITAIPRVRTAAVSLVGLMQSWPWTMKVDAGDLDGKARYKLCTDLDGSTGPLPFQDPHISLDVSSNCFQLPPLPPETALHNTTCLGEEKPVMNGGTCSITCAPGYHVTNKDQPGSRTFACVDGKLVGSPTCTPRECGPPPDRTSEHSVLACSGNTFGDVCNLECGRGHILSDLPGFQIKHEFGCELQSNVPEANVSWPKNVPKCVPLPCVGTVPAVEFALPTNCTGITYGGGCPVTCIEGYEGASGTSSAGEFTCGYVEGVGVSFEGQPKCQPVVCSGRPAIPVQNGVIDPTCQDMTFSSEPCPVVCNPGYVPRGNVSCNAQRQYVGNPECLPAPCTDPGFIDHAVEDSMPTSMKSGEERELVCEAGFKPIGKFSCNLGAYEEMPLCVPEDEEVTQSEVIAAKVSLSMDLTPPDGQSLEDFANSPDVKLQFAKSIAAGIGTLSEGSELIVEAVRIVAGAAEERRLSTKGRRLSNHKFIVDFYITVPPGAEAADIASTVSSRMSDPEFGSLMAEDLQDGMAKNLGVEVTVDKDSIAVASAPAVSKRVTERAPPPPPATAAPPKQQREMGTLVAGFLVALFLLVCLSLTCSKKFCGKKKKRGPVQASGVSPVMPYEQGALTDEQNVQPDSVNFALDDVVPTRGGQHQQE